MPAGFQAAFQTNLSSGQLAGLSLQAPDSSSLGLAPNPAGDGKVLHIAMHRDANYGNVANGVPRAEVAVLGMRLGRGSSYWIAWRMRLPADYTFDTGQPEGVAQIHEGPNTGTPPVSITLSGGRYQLDTRGGDGTDVHHADVGSADGDRGRWVDWALHYTPDHGGVHAVTEVYRQGQLAVDGSGQPNAYVEDDQAYFKFGLYKWGWQKGASDVTERVLDFGDVTISRQSGS